MQKKAIILFSGGLDSTTCLAMAKESGFECYALSVVYGQKHEVELEAAKKIAKAMGAKEHRIIQLDFLKELGGSALTDQKIKVKDFTETFHDTNDIPDTYVPARNTIFLSTALSWAEIIGAFDIFFGANAIDYSGYPDCRPAYLQAFETMANLATKAGIEGKHLSIHVPLIQLTKARIIQEGIRLGVDYSMTISCYRADKQGHACGRCDSCAYRKKGFEEAGVSDPTRYVGE